MDCPADGADVFCRNADREMSFATRSLLMDRAKRLAQALRRLHDGTYGVCEECGEIIAGARLRAMPEVTTCVRCQDRLERSRRVDAARVPRDPDVQEED
jgi:DnaK suppressor protein